MREWALGEEMRPQSQRQERVGGSGGLVRPTSQTDGLTPGGQPLPQLGGGQPPEKKEVKTPLVFLPGDFQSSLILCCIASSQQPWRKNARLFQVITFINNDQKYPAMFNEVLERDNYQGMET